METGEYTTADLADLFGVARSTVYQAVEPEGSNDEHLCGRDLKTDIRAAVSHKADLCGIPPNLSGVELDGLIYRSKCGHFGKGGTAPVGSVVASMGAEWPREVVPKYPDFVAHGGAQFRRSAVTLS